MLVTFPLFPVLSDGKCGCGDEACTKAGKHPAVRGWADLRASVPVPPGCGTGILCGQPSGIIVVDLDTKEAQIPGDLPETFTVRTGRRPEPGAHLYYAIPPGADARKRQSPGWDVQAEASFVVAPGSKHRSGATYEVVDGRDPVPAPPWLLEFCGPRSPSAAPVHRTPGVKPGPADLQRIEVELALEAPAVQGEAGSTRTFEVLQKYLILQHWDYASIRHLLEAWNLTCQPPWGPDEWERKVEEVLTKSRLPEGDPHAAEWVQERVAAARAVKQEAKVAARHSYDWSRAVISVEGEDGPKPVTFEWICLALQREPWAGVFYRDEFYGGRVRAKDPIFPLTCEGIGGRSKEDVALVRRWLEREKRYVTKASDVADAMDAAANMEPPRNSAREWMASLPASQPGEIVQLGARLSKHPRAHELLRKWMIGCVARIYQPGCQFDTMLVLCGVDGGERKSSFFRELASRPWYRSHVPDIHDPRKVGQALVGHLIVEFGELHAMRKADKEHVKEFLQRTHDKHDPKFKSEEVEAPRMCGFAGTSNEVRFLDGLDRAVQRRFWPIHVRERIDTAWIAEHRDAVWAEARDAYLAGELWYYENERELDGYRADFLAIDTLEDVFAAHVGEGDRVKRSLSGKNLTEIYLNVFPRTNGYPPRQEAQRLANLLRKEGFVERKSNGKQAFFYESKEESQEGAGQKAA